VFFEVYRWAGTSVKEFREHLKTTHAPLASRFPGVVWYESFLNNDAADGWPSESAPVPDAFVIMEFESKQALENATKSAEWAEAQADNPGFLSHFNTFAVDRITWIPDPENRRPFQYGA
jgi:uncharacterized protein (TIGR02118 family)